MAKIIIRRKSAMVGAAQSYYVYLLNEYIGELTNGGIIEIPVDVGTHRLSFNSKIKMGGKNTSFNCVVNYPDEIVELEAKFSMPTGDFVVDYADNAPHIPIDENKQTQQGQQEQHSYRNATPIVHTKKKPKKFFKRILIVIAVIMVLTIFSAIISDEDTSSTNDSKNNDAIVTSSVESPEVETTIPYIEITANELWNEFSDNEVAAEKKYSDKAIKVTGVISDINSADTFTYANILLEVDGLYSGSIQCNFNSSKKAEALAGLEKGQKVTIAGTCDTLNLFNVIIDGCEVVE